MTIVAILGSGPLAQVVLRVGAHADGVEFRVHAPRVDQLSGSFVSTDDLGAAVDGARLVLLAGPTSELAGTAESFGEHARADQVVLLPARGVRPGFELPLATVRNFTCIRKIGIIGGPLHVRELDEGHHVNAVIATRFPEVWEMADRLIDPNRVSLHRSRDVVGVQVAGVYSHIASLIAGMALGLDAGETARGLLLAQSLSEARALGVGLGAEERTFASVAGLGELIPRPPGASDRHVEVGKRLARGQSRAEALEGIDAEVEGLIAAEEALEVAAHVGVGVPVASAVVEVASGRTDARSAIHGLLKRPLPGTP